MQLNKFKAVAKPRNPWQAIDLGMVMARAWYFQLFLLWVVPAGLLFLILVVFFFDTPYIPALIVWWFKPMWERPILHVVSRQLFDNTVTVQEVFKGYLKIVKFDLLAWLTWRRLSVYRSFDMPVTQLEQLKGKARTSRLNLLHLRYSGAGAWLLLVSVHIELFILIGIVAALALLIPQGVNPDWQLWLMDNAETLNHLYNALWFLSAALVAPFYTCAGFALYLQRRIDLEAWDIEIQFRRLLQRKNTRKRAIRADALILVISASIMISLTSQELVAQETVEQSEAYLDTYLNETADEIADETVDKVLDVLPSAEQKAAKEQIEAVYQSDDFQTIEHRSGFRLIPEEEKLEQMNPEWLIKLVEWLESGGDIFGGVGKLLLAIAKFIEVIFWVVFAGLIIYIVFYYRVFILRAINYRSKEEKEVVVPPTTLFGLDVTEESLPEDIVDAAQRAWHEEGQRAALALLLRASIVEFIDMRCTFFSGNTEKECALIVRKKLSQAYSRYFDGLVRHWLALAYAHTPCSDGVFEQLCVSWRETFRHV